MKLTSENFGIATVYITATMKLTSENFCIATVYITGAMAHQPDSPWNMSAQRVPISHSNKPMA